MGNPQLHKLSSIMKLFRILFHAALGIGFLTHAYGQVPHLLNYQGRISVGGTNYEGPGQFKFALVGKQANTGSRQATATAEIFFGGLIYNLVIMDGGAGYFTPPRVTFTHPAGQGAVWEAIVSGGAVVDFNDIALGSNYTSTVVVNIEPPPDFLYPSYWSNDRYEHCWP